MPGSGVVFAKDWMMNDGGGHLFDLCTLFFVLGLVELHNKVPSTKYKDQTLSQSKFDDRTKLKRIKDPSDQCSRTFFKQLRRF